MEDTVYKRHIDNFNKHWWFQGRKKIIENINILNTFSPFVFVILKTLVKSSFAASPIDNAAEEARPRPAVAMASDFETPTDIR